MNESEDSAELPLAGAKWACGLGAALLLGFAAVTASAMYDKAHLASLETVSEPTAVGDKAFFPPSARDPGTRAVAWNGTSLSLADGKNVEASDAKMLKAGRDDTHSFFIYTSSAPETGNPGPAWYLKVGDGEYLKVLR